ncbi:hypothetical protein J4437_05150 [Candidatus Woesearchaeota archaeon]|nr:hypothetical protein [Candidatus Woesearchaeota archaeon]
MPPVYDWWSPCRFLHTILMAFIAEFGCTGGSRGDKTCTGLEIVKYYFKSLIDLPFNSIDFLVYL